MPERRRIALDYTPAYEQGGGIGRYVRELVEALARLDDSNEYRLFVAGARSDLPTTPGNNFQWRPVFITPRWFARIWHRARLPLPVELFTGHIDLYHATDFVLPPVRPGTRTLLTVHDLSFVRVPETAAPSLKHYLDEVVPRSIASADHVLADSESTRADIISLYGAPPEKISVLLSGVNECFQPASQQDIDAMRVRYGIEGRTYIFTIGTVQPRKNYARLIHALAILRGRGYDLHLVIAGGKGWLEDPIYAAIRTHHMGEYVHFIGFAAEADLPALYTGSLCLAFPSLYEGFGLPILEAMACGTPTITSNISSLPEVAGDASLIIDPLDVEALADAIQRIVDDSALRQSLMQRGRLRAAEFTWQRSAQQLLDLYRQILNPL